MRYHNITKDDMLNGDGLRVVLWVAGCGHHCKGCQNPITWDPNGGIPFDDAAKAEIFEQLDKDYISGITFSGGDPLYEANRADVTEEEYLHMIYLKTSVLIAGSMRHGALIAGAPEHEYKALYDFGGYLGLVFQLQDDYLDVYGDTEEFGKKIGGDILCNKKTYLLIKAFELAGESDRALLRLWLTKKDFNPQEKIQAVTEIYNRVGVKEAVMNIVDDYMEKSRLALEKIDVPEERKVNFRDMIEYIGDRSTSFYEILFYIYFF